LAAAGGGRHGGERGVECPSGTRNVFAVCAVGPASRGTDLEGGNCGTARGTRSCQPGAGLLCGGGRGAFALVLSAVRSEPTQLAAARNPLL
jgi:hypothetical protein